MTVTIRCIKDKLAHVLKLKEVTSFDTQKFYNNRLMSKIIILHFRFSLHGELPPLYLYHQTQYLSAKKKNVVTSQLHAYLPKLHRRVSWEPSIASKIITLHFRLEPRLSIHLAFSRFDFMLKDDSEAYKK